MKSPECFANIRAFLFFGVNDVGAGLGARKLGETWWVALDLERLRRIQR